MRVIPLAAESFGVRSMATYVETPDCRILIDPSAALGEYRSGYHPHPLEEQALEQRLKRIDWYARRSDILVISHYHFDHHDPGDTFYRGKRVYAKDLDANINQSQRGRGRVFKRAQEGGCELVYCDGTEVQVGRTRVTFSKPVPHGPAGTKLGYVVMTTIERGERVMHASDVQGPMSKAARDIILENAPDLLIIDGPPTYLLGSYLSKGDLELAVKNLLAIIKKLDCGIILDHHLLRDLDHREKLAKVYDSGDVKSAAEYLGEKDNLLEARRKELHQGGE